MLGDGERLKMPKLLVRSDAHGNARIEGSKVYLGYKRTGTDSFRFRYFIKRTYLYFIQNGKVNW